MELRFRWPVMVVYYYFQLARSHMPPSPTLSTRPQSPAVYARRTIELDRNCDNDGRWEF